MKSNNPLIRNPIFPFIWIGISILLLIADYFAGPFIQFPISFLIPVALASWYNGRWWGLTFALIMPLVRFYFNIALWTIPWTTVEAGLNALIRITVLSAFSLVIDRTANQTRKLSKEVNMLEGLLPICSFCKKIRDENNEWQPMEKYISAHSTVAFSHGLCPDCLQEHYRDLAREKG